MKKGCWFDVCLECGYVLGTARNVRPPTCTRVTMAKCGCSSERTKRRWFHVPDGYLFVEDA
jgi:hypothetical protein